VETTADLNSVDESQTEQNIETIKEIWLICVLSTLDQDQRKRYCNC